MNYESSYVLVRNGSILFSGSEADCETYAKERLADDNYGVLTYQEYQYFATHPSEVRKLTQGNKGIAGRIVRNIKSGRAHEFANRPTKKRRRRWRKRN